MAVFNQLRNTMNTVRQTGTAAQRNGQDPYAAVRNLFQPQPAPQAAPSGTGGGNTDQGFTDPFARGYQDQIGAYAARMNQPVNNPDFQPMVDYLRKYMTQLQGPAYTPAQMELMQTQSLQPIEQQRQAERQQVIQRLAAKGINPGSGIVEKALQEVDRSFDQQRTGTQAGFATNAINLDRQNAAQAAQIGQTLSGLQNQQSGTQDQRMLSAVQALGLLPALADSRLQNAQQFANSQNPLAMFAAQQSQNQQNMNNQNTQQMWANIFNLAGSMFGGR